MAQDSSSSPARPMPTDMPEDVEATYSTGKSRERRGAGAEESPSASRTQMSASKADGEDDSSSDQYLQPMPFTMRKHLARGGFGEVWEATQNSLGRPIAVKRMREDLHTVPGFIHTSERQRDYIFLQEALTAAGLEHPNIVPVHDLGLDDRGRPLLAMKLVRGRVWKLVMREDFVAMPVYEYLAKHLPILLSVCQAVAFAHSRGIIHRDLKPSQVMVGEFGETLLMDWGIAVVYDTRLAAAASSNLLTAGMVQTPSTASSPAGTVAYMAPEQTAERATGVGPWTDIYLLGGMLYTLLTCRPPHGAGDRMHAFYQAGNGHVTPMEEAAPGREIPPELRSLALRALSPLRESRPQSVEAFAAALRECLAHVERRREAASLLASVKIPRGGEAEGYGAWQAAISSLDRALGLDPACAEAQIRREECLRNFARAALGAGDLRLARLTADRLTPSKARTELVEEILDAEEQTRLAEEQLERARNQVKEERDRAREAHERAERLVAFLLEDLHRGLEQVNRLDLLSRVSQEALGYFDSLPEGESAERSLHNRAIAYRNIGDVFRAQGNLVEAHRAFSRLHDICGVQLRTQPGDYDWALLLSDSDERLAMVQYYQGDLDAALAAQERSLATRRELRQIHGDRADLLERIAHNNHQIGVVLWRRGENAASLPVQLESLAILKGLIEKDPENLAVRGRMAWNLGTLGNLYRDLDQLDRAIEVTQESIAIREDLISRDPKNRTRLDDACWSRTNLALMKEYQGDARGALEAFERALEIRRRLLSEDPTNATHQSMFVFARSSVGRILMSEDRLEEARVALEEACRVSTGLVEKDPTNTREWGSFGLSHAYLGQVLFHLGGKEESRRIAALAMPAAERAFGKMRKNGVFQNAMCQSLLLRGLIAADDGHRAEAIAAWSQAVEILDMDTWRETTAQGVALVAELRFLLGEVGPAREALGRLRSRRWSCPRVERLIDPDCAPVSWGDL